MHWTELNWISQYYYYIKIISVGVSYVAIFMDFNYINNCFFKLCTSQVQVTSLTWECTESLNSEGSRRIDMVRIFCRFLHFLNHDGLRIICTQRACIDSALHHIYSLRHDESLFQLRISITFFITDWHNSGNQFSIN